MKKIIIAAAVILTTGVLTVITNDNRVKTAKTISLGTTYDKNVIANAD